MKTARALGLTIRQPVLLRVDEVIQYAQCPLPAAFSLRYKRPKLAVQRRSSLNAINLTSDGRRSTRCGQPHFAIADVQGLTQSPRSRVPAVTAGWSALPSRAASPATRSPVRDVLRVSGPCDDCLGALKGAFHGGPSPAGCDTRSNRDGNFPSCRVPHLS